MYIDVGAGSLIIQVLGAGVLSVIGATTRVRRFIGEFEAFLGSGLYDELTREGLLVAHRAADRRLAATEDAACVIQPEVVPFISYPYEWCFGQLRDAALLTLDVQRRALRRGMSLKDASAYNVQFRMDCRPVLI